MAFPFDVEDIEKVISLYHLGTVQNGYREGSITFPFIDVKSNVRTIQVKRFNKNNHTTGTDFLHSIIEKYHTRNNKPMPKWLKAYNNNKTKVSCLFGEHLLSKYPHKPVALVEAPKTAIYGALYFGFPEQPQNLLWLAVYNLSSLNLTKCKVLKGRNVYLFPDLSKDSKAFLLWSDKARKIQSQLRGTYLEVSDLLEQLAPEKDKEQGKDLADYLIKQDWRLFRKQQIKEQQKPEPKAIVNSISEKGEKSVAFKKTFILKAEPLPEVSVIKKETIELLEKKKQENWQQLILELEVYFSETKLPIELVQINQCATIINIPLFIESHLATVKANKGNKTYLPYLNRLQVLKQVLTTNSIIT